MTSVKAEFRSSSSSVPMFRALNELFRPTCMSIPTPEPKTPSPSAVGRFRPVLFPDPGPSPAARPRPPTASLALEYGDFVSLATRPAWVGSQDLIVTCYFIDTVRAERGGCWGWESGVRV